MDHRQIGLKRYDDTAYTYSIIMPACTIVGRRTEGNSLRQRAYRTRRKGKADRFHRYLRGNFYRLLSRCEFLRIIHCATMLNNLFAALPADTSCETFEDLLNVPGLRIERIVTHGQASPPGFWYQQDKDEWVIVLQGSASLQVEGRETLVVLERGDHYWIPAGLRHRVDSTALNGPTIWLAVHR